MPFPYGEWKVPGQRNIENTSGYPGRKEKRRQELCDSQGHLNAIAGFLLDEKTILETDQHWLSEDSAL